MENGKIARATHNVAAWRVWDEARGVQLHDNDDDGTVRSLRFFIATLPYHYFLSETGGLGSCSQTSTVQSQTS